MNGETASKTIVLPEDNERMSIGWLASSDIPYTADNSRTTNVTKI